jgi:hypothetical protein
MTTQNGGGSHKLWVPFVLVLLLTALAGCDVGDDEGDDEGAPVAGTFVGRVPDTQALLAVVAAPVAEGEDDRNVTVYVCDGRRLCELYSGLASGNDFEATSDDDAEADGELTEDAATGSVQLPDGETADYRVRLATATAGVYNLTVSPEGELRGASATGVALRGQSTLPRPGAGTLRLADRTRLKFEVARDAEGDGLPLQAGQVRLIVLPDGGLAGAGKSRGPAGEGKSGFFIRSS